MAWAAQLLPTDIWQWLPLWKSYQTFYRVDIPESITQLTWKRFFHPAEPMFCAVAKQEGRIVGFVHYLFHRSTWAESDYCYLEDLFVDPQLRGRGIARQLMQALRAEAKEQGWSRLYWHTRTDNPARRLYDEFTPADDYVRYRITC